MAREVGYRAWRVIQHSCARLASFALLQVPTSIGMDISQILG